MQEFHLEVLLVAVGLGVRISAAAQGQMVGVPDRAVLVFHGLVSRRGQVDNAQALVPQPHAAVGINAPVIRPPVRQFAGHGIKQVALH